jgi:hypothetical protein
LGIPVGEATLKIQGLVHQIKRASSFDQAVAWAKSLNRLQIPMDGNETASEKISHKKLEG